ncbi:phosphotransferase enzyme family protein [Streptomyces sp. NPDC050485]|uniref:phosphotransferase enzyme family protein n=1 Tax=Streptomyces sp. NPDC050485 TaxID=3365617 RepID=UPI0037B301B4
MSRRAAEAAAPLTAALLARAYGLVPRRVANGPCGTVTRNLLVTDETGMDWFVKVYPNAGERELERERTALELAEFARAARLPVPAVRPTLDGDLLARENGAALSVQQYVAGVRTAEGCLAGPLWPAVGTAVGRLHHALAQHPETVPHLVPTAEVCGMGAAEHGLRALVDAYETRPGGGVFERWALETARERLAALPQIAAVASGLPPEMTAQVVHGDLAAPNVLLHATRPRVAALVDFRPPRPRSAAWELSRIGCDPRTVLGDPQWPQGLARLLSAYRAAYPALPTAELISVPRLAAVYTACSTYPLSVPLEAPDTFTPGLEAYAHARYRAVGQLIGRLDEAEGVLRDCFE